MNKKIVKCFSISLIIALVINSTGAYAGEASIWEKAWNDFFKTLEKWSTTYQQKNISNELKWSADNLNNFLIINKAWCWEANSKPCFTWTDFTIEEMHDITELQNVSRINSHLSEDNKTINIKQILNIQEKMSEWYLQKSKEILKKEQTLEFVWGMWLYSDWDVQNSGYDIIDDLDKIHKIIFSQETKYNWTANNSKQDSMDISDWLWFSPSATYSPNEYWAVIWNGDLWNSTWNSDDTTKNNLNSNNNNSESKNLLSSESNKCNTWWLLWNLDTNLIIDLQSQLANWENGWNISWWNADNSWEQTMQQNSNSNLTWSWNWGNWSNWSSWWKEWIDEFPCEDFFCIKIEMTMYTQNLLWWAKNTIEDIIDKHFKIINKYANKSMIQADMTKNFFSLSILRKLNLPSLAYIWMVVTYLPAPILNLNKKWAKQSNEFEIDTVLDAAFEENWLNLKRQNYLNPDYEYKNISEWANMTIEQATNKIYSTHQTYVPYVSNTKILSMKTNNNYSRWIDDDISELQWFSNTFQDNIKEICATILKMKKK